MSHSGQQPGVTMFELDRSHSVVTPARQADPGRATESAEDSSSYRDSHSDCDSVSDQGMVTRLETR